MNYLAAPRKQVAGSLELPGDKSISHRALMLSALADEASEISGFLASEDCLATLRALRALGVVVEQSGGTTVLVRGVGMRGLTGAADALDMGNAGTAMRLFAGLLAGQAFASTLIGDASLMKRPMERVAEPLRAMGAEIDTTNGRPPVRVGGGRALRGIDYSMPVASAQVKSAILLAGLYAAGETSVTSPAVCRDHTERMLRSFGVDVATQGLRTTVRPVRRLLAHAQRVPADFSSAAFFIVAGLLGADGGGLHILDVGLNPTRTGLLDILRSMGANIEIRNRRDSGAEPLGDLWVRPSALRGIAVPTDLIPLAIDELPVLFVAAACARGTTLITGAEELRVKESDRIAAMGAGLGRLGVVHDILEDGMRIQGVAEGPAFTGGEIDSHGDHRVAMAFAIASLRAAGPITIRDVDNVATSFPGFLEASQRVGLGLVRQDR